MSVTYRAVQWNRHKFVYDALVGVGVILFIGLFVGVSATVYPDATPQMLLIRGLGACAFCMLTLILCIGPLARLDRRFLPLLYNRRHLGVATFLIALLHGALVTLIYHGFGELNPFVSLLVSDGRWDSLRQFPFQPLGVAALLILFLMAATSHDFWLKNLSPRAWKTLHMLVYAAWALLLAHVGFGWLRDARSPLLVGLLGADVALVVTLHLAAAMRTTRQDHARDRVSTGADDALVEVGEPDSIPVDQARIVHAGSESIAVFRHGAQGERFSAISNVCAHQGGPLGEGRIINGCATCPWHGYQYRPEDACSPPPYHERLHTYDLSLRDGRLYVNPAPNALGKTSAGVTIDRTGGGETASEERSR